MQVWEAWNAEPEGSSHANYADLNDPTVAERFYKDGFTYWVGKIESRTELEAIQAQRYAEYFAVYKKYSQNMDRVTFWGLTDYLNWRATHNPQLFNQDWSEKLSAPAVANPEAWLGVKKSIVDTSTLSVTMAEANALDLKGNVYTGKSLGAVRGALGKANAVINSGRSQAEVNAANQALAEAVAALQTR